MFNEIMRTGVFEFYIFTEPGKKKGKTKKMFGIVDYSTNNVTPIMAPYSFSTRAASFLLSKEAHRYSKKS